MKKDKKRKLMTNNSGVVGIVATVLLIGLIITFVGIVQTVHVPNWLKQKEAHHMNDVQTQFTQLKYTIDVLSLLEEHVSIANYITLGTEELPVLNTGRTYDTLEILSNNFQITFSNATDSFSLTTSGILYSSKNSHFVDQIICLEAGALILSQTPSSILLGQPLFSITNYTNVSLWLFDIAGLEGKSFVSGYGTYILSNEFISRTTHRITDVTSINISTDYPEAWGDFFNSSAFVNSGLTYSMTLGNQTLHIEYSISLGNFDIEVIDIHSQLAIWRY